MWKTKRVVLAIMLSIIVSGISYAEEAKSQYVLKLGTIAPEMSAWGAIANKYGVKGTYEASKGRVKVLPFYGGVMGDEPVLVRKTRLGHIQATACTTGAASTIAPEIGIMDLPFLFRDRDEAAYIMDKYFDTFAKFFAEKGVILAGATEIGYWDFFTRKPVSTREELTKMKIQVTGSEVIYSTLKAWDIPFAPLPPADAIPAVQTGLVDGGVAPLEMMIGAQLFSVAPYGLKVHWIYQHAVFILNKEFFDKMPEDLQKIGMNQLKITGKEVTKALRKSNDELWPKVGKYGMKVKDPSPQAMEDFQKRSRPVWDQLADKEYPRWLLNDILKSLEEYRAQKKGVIK